MKLSTLSYVTISGLWCSDIAFCWFSPQHSCVIKPGSGLETRLGGARVRVKIREQRPQEIKCITKPLIVILDITVSLRPFLVVSCSLCLKRQSFEHLPIEKCTALSLKQRTHVRNAFFQLETPLFFCRHWHHSHDKTDHAFYPSLWYTASDQQQDDRKAWEWGYMSPTFNGMEWKLSIRGTYAVMHSKYVSLISTQDATYSY